MLRNALVDRLIARGDVRDDGVIAALRTVPRHEFMPEFSPERAYANDTAPIGFEQTISQPTVVAIMTEALELTGHERVLEVGTGSGYQAAVLSLIARDVYSIECVPALAMMAERRLAHAYPNVHVRAGDGYLGWPELAPFDRILLTAAPNEIPDVLLDQLADGGILVAPVGGPEYFSQHLVRIRKTGGSLQGESLGGVQFVPMVHPIGLTRPGSSSPC